MSKASVDLPEPDTPVTTVNRSRGISTSTSRRMRFPPSVRATSSILRIVSPYS